MVIILLTALILAVALIAGLISVTLWYVTQSAALAKSAGALALPVLIVVLFGYWLLTMGVDDAAPGNVLAGMAMLLAIVTPTAVLTTSATVRIISRRGR